MLFVQYGLQCTLTTNLQSTIHHSGVAGSATYLQNPKQCVSVPGTDSELVLCAQKSGTLEISVGNTLRITSLTKCPLVPGTSNQN